jgi:hypothetical protein
VWWWRRLAASQPCTNGEERKRKRFEGDDGPAPAKGVDRTIKFPTFRQRSVDGGVPTKRVSKTPANTDIKDFKLTYIQMRQLAPMAYDDAMNIDSVPAPSASQTVPVDGGWTALCASHTAKISTDYAPGDISQAYNNPESSTDTLHSFHPAQLGSTGAPRARLLMHQGALACQMRC